MSALWVRARPQTTGPSTTREIFWTASKSPGEVIGKPASITSTPSRASCWAISTFSAVFSEMPGDCSPSLRVVSKMWTRLASDADPIGSPSLLSLNDLCLSRLSRRPALFPPRGEEKEKREAVEPEAHSSKEVSAPPGGRLDCGDRTGAGQLVGSLHLAGADRDGHRGDGDRQRLLGDQRRPADDGEGLRHQHQHDPV